MSELHLELEPDYYIDTAQSTESPERCLWLAVVVRAVADHDVKWVSAKDCDTVCAYAGIEKAVVVQAMHRALPADRRYFLTHGYNRDDKRAKAARLRAYRQRHPVAE